MRVHCIRLLQSSIGLHREIMSLCCSLSAQSTLLQCLLDELQPVRGSVELQGTVSYSSQDPWVFSATLRENILFGKPYDKVWYEKVVTACALDKVGFEGYSVLWMGMIICICSRWVSCAIWGK